MPLFQIGYRRYEGTRTPHFLRWWPITRTGVTIAWRSKLLRRLVYASYLPFLYFGPLFFLIGRMTDPGATADDPLFEMAREMLGRDMAMALVEDPSSVRQAVWSVIFASFGGFFQLYVAALLAAIVGPPMIANDMRSRSFLIYFARPVSRLDYVVGKVAAVVAILGSATVLPLMLLYAASIAFSPSLETFVQTVPVAADALVGSLTAVTAGTLLVLVLSSVTRQARFAAAAWIVIWGFGPIVHFVLQSTRDFRDASWTFLFSFPHTLRAMWLGVFDVESRITAISDQDYRDLAEVLTPDQSLGMAALWLALISTSCFLLLLRRVDAPTRI